MVDHILEIPRLLVFGGKCYNCDATNYIFINNLAWNTDDIEVVINSHVYWDTLYLCRIILNLAKQRI